MVWASRHTWYLRASHLSAKKYFTSLFKINFISKQLLHIQHSTENLRPRAWKPHCDSYTCLCVILSPPSREWCTTGWEGKSLLLVFIQRSCVSQNADHNIWTKELVQYSTHDFACVLFMAFVSFVRVVLYTASVRVFVWVEGFVCRVGCKCMYFKWYRSVWNKISLSTGDHGVKCFEPWNTYYLDLCFIYASERLGNP